MGSLSSRQTTFQPDRSNTAASRSHDVSIHGHDLNSDQTLFRSFHNYRRIPVSRPPLALFQAKLSVSGSTDFYEREANRVANRVMQMPKPGGNVNAMQFNDTSGAKHHENNSTKIEATFVRSGHGQGSAVVLPSNHLRYSGGQPLNKATRAFMEPRFGTDFTHVRIHTDAQATRMNRSLNARALTYKNHIYYGSARSPASDHLTAHELVHVLQQSGAPSPSIHRTPDREAPSRYSTIHENLFVRAPSGGTLQQWVNSSQGVPGTAQAVITQFKNTLRAYVASRPASVGGSVPTRTTESAAESDAIGVDQSIRNRFPQITTQLSEAQIRSAVGILSPSQTSASNFIRQWLGNRLSMWTDVDDYNIRETDPRYQQMLTDLLADSYAGPHIRTLVSRQSAFVETSGSSRRVFIHRGAKADLRRLILIHELTHFYAHQGFKDWVAATNAPRIYTEGFTEYLARQVMTTSQRQSRRSYRRHLQKIETQVARYVSVDDIARAYFNGEVWRLESRSVVSRQLFESHTGLREGAARSEERSRSRIGPGIVQTVDPGTHYRFMNLGINQSQPKPEHVTFFQTIYSRYVQGHPNVRLRFVGYGSSPGSTSLNRRLSRARSLAFYQMAQNAGVLSSQLLDENNPPHHGESSPTAENANVHGRVFNRRVELLISV